MLERVLLEHISGHVREEAAIRRSQHGLTKGSSCLIQLIVFCDKMTRFADDERAVDVSYLDSSKVLTLSPTIFLYPTGPLQSGREGNQMGKRTLDGWAQRLWLMGHVMSRGQYQEGYQRGVSWDLLHSTSLSVTQRRGQKALLEILANDTILGGPVDMLEGRAAVQRNWTTGTWWNFKRTKIEPCSRGGRAPGNDTRLDKRRHRAALQRPWTTPCQCGAFDLGWLPTAHPVALVFPLLNRTGEENRMKKLVGWGKE